MTQTWTDRTLTRLNLCSSPEPAQSDAIATWQDYTLARIALIAHGTGGCNTVLPKPSSQALIEFRAALEGRREFDDLRFFDLREQVIRGYYPEGTLGDALRLYYLANGIGELDGTDIFPLRYIFLHDAHHALLGCNTDEQGELNVLAYECGQIDQGRTVAAIMPLLAQVLAFSDWLKSTVGTVEELKAGKVPPLEHPLRLCAEYWQMGTESQVNLLDGWDVAVDLPRPLDELRQQYGVTL